MPFEKTHLKKLHKKRMWLVGYQFPHLCFVTFVSLINPSWSSCITDWRDNEVRTSTICCLTFRQIYMCDDKQSQSPTVITAAYRDQLYGIKMQTAAAAEFFTNDGDIYDASQMFFIKGDVFLRSNPEVNIMLIPSPEKTWLLDKSRNQQVKQQKQATVMVKMKQTTCCRNKHEHHLGCNLI